MRWIQCAFLSYHRCSPSASVIIDLDLRVNVCACFQAHFTLSIWQIYIQTTSNSLQLLFLSTSVLSVSLVFLFVHGCMKYTVQYFTFRKSTRKMAWVTDLNSHSFYTTEILRAFRALCPAPTRAQCSLSLFSWGPLVSDLLEKKSIIWI